jgi:hypothetical protein
MDDGRHEAVEEPRRIKIRLVILSVDVSPILTWRHFVVKHSRRSIVHHFLNLAAASLIVVQCLQLRVYLIPQS